MNEEETMPGWFYRITLIIGEIEGSEKLEKMDIGRVTHYAMIPYTDIYTRDLLTLTFQGERRRMSSGNSDGRDGAGEQVKENSNDVKIFIFYNLANFHRSKFRS